MGDAAAELRALVREKPAPEETRAFPIEKGVLLTPEDAATKRKKGRSE
jgi:serine/threonine-protein kinase